MEKWEEKKQTAIVPDLLMMLNTKIISVLSAQLYYLVSVTCEILLFPFAKLQFPFGMLNLSSSGRMIWQSINTSPELITS